MKIAIFTDSFYPQINGVVTSIVDLSKGMANYGHKVFIIAPEDGDIIDEFQYKNIEVLRIPAVDASFYDGFKWSSIMHKPTYQRLKKENIDIVHFMTPITVSVFGILVGKMLKKPIIGTYHTFISEITYLKQFWPNAGTFHQKVSWKYTNAYYNRAHLITIPTENAKKELKKNGCRIDVEVVSNGIKLDSFDNTHSKDIKKQLNPHGDLILYVGRVSPEKNMEVLLEAFKAVCKVDKTTKLLVIGGGPSLEDCKTFVQEHDMEERVIFTGLIPTAQVKKGGYFGAAKFFVTASTTETQSITVLEAEANGLPCIGPDANGIPNVIENNRNGYIVKPHNSKELSEAMLKLLLDDDICEEFSRRSLELAKEHDINKIVEGWDRRYRKVKDMPVFRIPRALKKIGNV